MCVCVLCLYVLKWMHALYVGGYSFSTTQNDCVTEYIQYLVSVSSGRCPMMCRR